MTVAPDRLFDMHYAQLVREVRKDMQTCWDRGDRDGARSFMNTLVMLVRADAALQKAERDLEQAHRERRELLR